MAHNYTVARPYARAIFEVAEERNQLEGWAVLLKGMSLIVADQQMQMLLTNPALTKQALTKMVWEIIESVLPDVIAKIRDGVEHLVAILVESQRIEIMADIATLYQQMLAKKQDMVRVEVFSAYPLEEMQQQQLEKALSKRFNSSVTMNFQEDEKLIGGVLIRAGNWVLDGSVKGKLTRLVETLS